MKTILSLVFVCGLVFCLGFTVDVQDSAPYQYISPQADAQYVSAATTVVVRPGALLDTHNPFARFFHVTGASSGTHAGTVVLARDQKTLVFQPHRPFASGETVDVTVDSGIRTLEGASLTGISYQFTVSASGMTAADLDVQRTPSQNDSAALPTFSAAQDVSETNGYVTVPFDFPALRTNLSRNEADGRYVFMAATGRNNDMATVPYLLILDDAGEPVYYRRMTAGRPVHDFKRQPNGLLTYWDTNDKAFHALDSSYTIVDTYQAGNGYEAETDVHELLLLPNDNFILMIYDFEQIDMSEIVPNGVPTATVVGLVIQELDVDRNVVFEWRSWDYFGFADSMYPLDTPVVDPVHGNSIEVDYDGHLLLSSRSMDEITKIHRHTGHIIWRFGGKNNHFKLINDDHFFHAQHDARRLPNGHLTLFDNRTGLSPRYSRAVEYELDEMAKTATLVWQYRNTPDVYSPFLSNVQRLPNDYTVIGWGGGKPTMTEVTLDGEKLMEVTLLNHATYRAFRFPWQGAPPWPPTLTSRVEDGRTILYYSWNGATNVSYYHIYAGSTREPSQLVHGTMRDGFETSTDITEFLGSYCFYQVVPFTADNQALTPSHVARAAGCDTRYMPIIGGPQ